MKPTPSQAVAHAEFCSWLTTQNTVPFVIGGGAGSGKTFTLMNLILPALIATRAPFVLTSTTHQANQMLEANLLESSESGEPPSTLHSMLGLQPTTQQQLRNPKGFERCGYKMRVKLPSNERFVLVVDEAYRIDKVLYDIMIFLYPYARLVLIGDPFQVPPVGEQQSHIELIDKVEVLLLESPRFTEGGTLGSVVTALRKAVANNEKDYWNLLPADDAHIELVKKSYVRDMVNALVDSGEPIADTEIAILCGTKKGEFAHNNYILNRREKAGQSLINYGEAYTVDTVIEANFEEQSETVSALRKERQFGSLLMLAEWVDCKYGIYAQVDPLTVVILVTPWATSSANEDFMKLVANCRRKGHDIVFIRLNIARTIHLAQGLTTKIALLDRDTINKWANHNMRRRLLYTGVSRAATKLIHF